MNKIWTDRNISQPFTIKGFTLLEIMITVVIIGVLAAIAIPNYQKTINRTYRQDAETQLKAMHSANKIYLAQNRTGYLAGSNITIGAINSGLNINLIGGGMTYTYTRTAPLTYIATSTRAGSALFTITITQADISGTNPSCAGPSSICN